MHDTKPIKEKRDSLNSCAMLIVSLDSHKPCTKQKKGKKTRPCNFRRLFSLLGLSCLCVRTTLHESHVHNTKPIKETRDSLNLRAYS